MIYTVNLDFRAFSLKRVGYLGSGFAQLILDLCRFGRAFLPPRHKTSSKGTMVFKSHGVTKFVQKTCCLSHRLSSTVSQSIGYPCQNCTQTERIIRLPHTWMATQHITKQVGPTAVNKAVSKPALYSIPQVKFDQLQCISFSKFFSQLHDHIMIFLTWRFRHTHKCTAVYDDRI